MDKKKEPDYTSVIMKLESDNKKLKEMVKSLQEKVNEKIAVGNKSPKSNTVFKAKMKKAGVK